MAIVENIEFGIGCRRVIPEDEVVDVRVVDGHLSVYVDRRLVHSQTGVFRQCMPVGGTCKKIDILNYIQLFFIYKFCLEIF